MLAKDFINRLKTKSFQNISNEQYQDDDWVFYINAASNYLYRFFNGRNIWPYSAHQEIVTASPASTEFSTTYKIQWIIKDIYSESAWVDVDISWYNTIETRKWYIDNSNTGVRANPSSLTANDWKQVTRKNFFPTPWQDEFAFKIDQTGIIGITTGNSYDSVLIRYKRWPRKIETADIATVDVDVPDDLLGALQNLVMRYAMPVYLENGINVSKAYQEQAIEDMKNYAELIGMMIDTERFSA
jgi:hypothetical protein